MKPPTAHELTRISGIAAAFCAIALAAAFAGAGVTAFAVLALVVGPVSILLYRGLSKHDLDGRTAGDHARQAHLSS